MSESHSKVSEESKTAEKWALAEARISSALAKNSHELDLSGLELKELPPSFNSLKGLRSLDLSTNNLREIPVSILEYSPQIRRLDIALNELTALPTWIGELQALAILRISSAHIESLPAEIGKLQSLKGLIISGCPNLKALPDSFGDLKNLRDAHIFYTGLRTLPNSFSKLESLRLLDISNNHLGKVPAVIKDLKNLKHLDLEDNGLTSLPTWLRDIPLEELYLQENERLGIPTEILGPSWVGTSEKTLPQRPSVILDYYFRAKRAKRPLNEAKLILVGRGSVGKTSLIKRLIQNEFNPKEKETPGIEIKTWALKVSDGDKVRVHVWDFGGQEILHATHQFFLTERTLYLLVLSGREGLPTQDAEYWLQLIRSFGGNSRVIIALNKSCQHPFDINRGLLKEKYRSIACIIETDCKRRLGITALKKNIQSELSSMDHRKQSFPAEWFAIKERLASMDEDFVSWETYKQICETLGENDTTSQRLLAGHLHDLGIALNYSDDPRLQDTRVLNPRWVTEGIYAVLRVRVLAERLGVLEPSDLQTALDPERYPISKHDFLLRLMEKFQLCFRLTSRQERYLVPEMLGEDQPDVSGILSVIGLSFCYQYDILPEGILPRFIVQTHALSDAQPNLRWRSGVVLQHDDCSAVVRSDLREKRVEIHVIGPERRRRGLLAIIRSKFAEQHGDLRGIVVSERVPVPGQGHATVSYRDLLMREARGEKSFYPEGMDRAINVGRLLDGIESSQSRAAHRSVFQKKSDQLAFQVIKKQAKREADQTAGKCKLLFLAANPKGTSMLALDEECRAIDEKIRGSQYRDIIDPITKWAVRPDDLLQYLNQYRPHIVHFSGHGSSSEELVLVNNNQEVKPVSKRALVQLFKTLNDNIRVVVLNACYSQPQAEAIATVIDCTVGMQRSIGDKAAIVFAAAFYRAIGFGRSVGEAFQQGITALSLEGIPEDQTPQLLAKRGVDPNKVYLVS